MPWRRGAPHWRGAAPVGAGLESSRLQTRDRKLPDGRTNRLRQPSTPSPALPTVTPRAPRSGRRGGADSPGRLRVQLGHGRAAGDPGLHDPVPRAASFGAL